MPSDAYASVVRGGLKLKGSSGITKKKKKKSKERDGELGEVKKDALQKALEDEDSAFAKMKDKGKGKAGGDGELEEEGDKELEVEERGKDGKTASERAYEEMRRKRLHERLQKEGVKTHKEKVEELNKYLSNLSEHHDMPRIGPG
ncbi:DUF1754-domain-containing protein [Hyaloscypha hepaticicola]|uniref:DUF1754-domain-containing protein n=1 Tax=Hyaloscypha hepaticicola TaxID=2082293 RepID=A0A2J6QIQ7_9HELO|nr:DUF1754-domain-containing protein [Hyaloscypha hepaticicola]